MTRGRPCPSTCSPSGSGGGRDAADPVAHPRARRRGPRRDRARRRRPGRRHQAAGAGVATVDDRPTRPRTRPTRTRPRLGGPDAARRVPALPRRHRVRAVEPLRPRHAGRARAPAPRRGRQPHADVRRPGGDRGGRRPAGGAADELLRACPAPAPRRTAPAGRRRATPPSACDSR